MQQVFEALNLQYPKTEAGAPSFTKQFLNAHPHEVAHAIVRLREFDKADGTFIETILQHEHNGRIHCEFHQLRSDDGGTVTGRFSSSSPNLQQIPARDPELKSLIRGLFVPEPGQRWGSFDYSSQEPRLLVHYAASMPDSMRGPVVDNFVKGYQDEDFDFHQMVADIAGIDRKSAKTCIAEGELVLTDKGLVPIQEITVDHLVWDGVEWVRHEGLVYQGEKDVITYDGLTATPDHEVWVGRGRMLPLGIAASQKKVLARTGDGEHAIPLVDNYEPRDSELQARRIAKVYDIRNAGPRHRFTVSGILVHNCGLGIMYGMGIAKLANQLSVSTEEAKDLMETFDTRVPFVRQLATTASKQAEKYGQIRTLLGRKCRFHLYEPAQWSAEYKKALPLEEARKEYGPIVRRAFTYKALNKLIQGSAADQTKKAMADCFAEGLVPTLTVHDELCFSVESQEQANKIQEIMETGVSLKVPSKVDAELGSDWGEVG